MSDMNDRNEDMEPALDAFARDAARTLRAPVHITEGFHARTMAAVRRSENDARIVSPRKLFGLPALGMVAAAALLIGVAIGSRALSPALAGKPEAVASVPSQTVVTRDTVHVIRFQLAAPGAHTVALVGDFNDWSKEAIVLQPADKPGVWTASVPLTRGRHEYAFIVDGKRWVADPYALTHRDEYNVESSVIRVGESGT